MWHFTVYFTTLLKLISSYFSRKQNNEDDFLDDGKFTLYKNVNSEYNWKLSIHIHVVSEFAFFLIRLFVLLLFLTKYLFSVCIYYCWKNPEILVSADDCTISDKKWNLWHAIHNNSIDYEFQIQKSENGLIFHSI